MGRPPRQGDKGVRTFPTSLGPVQSPPALLQKERGAREDPGTVGPQVQGLILPHPGDAGWTDGRDDLFLDPHGRASLEAEAA